MTAFLVVLLAQTLLARDLPEDFSLVLDARARGESASGHVQIRISVDGRTVWDRYDTRGTIVGSEEILYQEDQILESGELVLSREQLLGLWESILEARFFELTGDYRMALGQSFAFVSVTADGRSHRVFNIGMDVPEVRTLVEAIGGLLPPPAQVVYETGAAF